MPQFINRKPIIYINNRASHPTVLMCKLRIMIKIGNIKKQKLFAIILSMQMVGAAAGNMIALADVLPALAVVGLKNKEVEVIKKVLIPCLIYTILAAFDGVCLLRVTG